MSFDKNKLKMNAFEVDYWIRVLEEDHFSTRMLDEESKNALLELFDKTAIFEPVGDDDKKAFWICAEPGIEGLRRRCDCPISTRRIG